MKINNNKDLINKIVYSYNTVWLITNLTDDEHSYEFIWIASKQKNNKFGQKGYITPCYLTIRKINEGEYKIL